MDVLYNAFFLLLAIGILVTFHEAGHFLVARWAGVHVVRFCVGFGKPLLSWRDRRGTEFCVAALPLGGYVRMFDRRDPDAASHAPADPRLAERSYDRLTPQWRLAIALGGPGANFVLAFLFYWLAAVVGVTVAIPHVGAVVADSPADQAGLRPGQEVVAVDGKPTNAWLDVGLALAARLGDSGVIEVETGGTGPAGRHRIPIQDWLVGEDDPDTVGALGLESGLLAAIGEVMADGPAELGGLGAGDRITHVDNEPVVLWSDFVEHVRGNPGRELRLAVVDDAGSERTLRITPGVRVDEDGARFGQIGAYVALPKRIVRYDPIAALGRAGGQTWSNTGLTVGLLAKMVTLTVSPSNISGPITIAVVAGESARVGIGRFLSILALLSISLGVINLLPIPILDGGQVVAHTLEIVRRKPLPPMAEAVGARLGIATVVGIMVLAFYNDFTRWF